jgi:tetratricopeptide (TPR) repeat protein
VVAKSSALRHNRAIALAVLGRRDEAIAESERLRRDDPEFKHSVMLLASVHGDEGRFAEALALMEALKPDLAGDASGPLAEAWFLRKLGRLDEAEAKVHEGRAIDPQSADVPLVLAGIALDRGDLAAAREQLALAERLSPGTVAVALVAAELALAADDPGAAAAVEKARAAARNNPLAFAEKEAAALAERLEARRGGGEGGPLVEVLPVG